MLAKLPLSKILIKSQNGVDNSTQIQCPKLRATYSLLKSGMLETLRRPLDCSLPPGKTVVIISKGAWGFTVSLTGWKDLAQRFQHLVFTVVITDRL
jgi:hypothetical protein